MKTAHLIYEPAIEAYSLKFSFDRTVTEFLKKAIPAHKRTTSGPPDWIWYFGSEYYDVIKSLFEALPQFNLRIVSEDEIKKLRSEQEQSSTFVPAELSLADELRRLYEMPPLDVVRLGTTSCNVATVGNLPTYDKAKTWYRTLSRTYHQDIPANRTHEKREKMTQLNVVWELLKKYYEKQKEYV